MLNFENGMPQLGQKNLGTKLNKFQTKVTKAIKANNNELE